MPGCVSMMSRRLGLRLTTQTAALSSTSFASISGRWSNGGHEGGLLQQEAGGGFTCSRRTLSAEKKNLPWSAADRVVHKEPEYDLVVVGGGIVGMATAREMAMRHPSLKFAVLEKEPELGKHQTGNNSGVIHAGIYYKPGSLKAKLCVEGLKLMYKYCDEEGIPYKKVGKLIVAADESEVGGLMDLYYRSIQNGADVEVIEKDKIQEIEPHCKGEQAILSPQTGIVDFALVTEHYGRNFHSRGGDIHLKFEVNDFQWVKETQHLNRKGVNYPIRVVSELGQAVRCKYVLTCGGLQSDRLAKISGCSPHPSIIPFRGEYLLLKPEKAHLVKGNIYPVPDPRFPFLGVHFTPRMNGDIWLGPNAILAYKREGYKYSDVSFRDLSEALRYPGFQKMARRFIGFGLGEMKRSLFPRLQIAALQRYIPEITAKDITKGPAGVRAQAMNPDGSLEEDFVFHREQSSDVGARVLHCRNAPSPGATSSLAIANMIADKLVEEFEF